MGLLECPDCKGKVSEIAPSCPHCGRPFGEGELTELLFKQKKRKQEEERKKGELDPRTGPPIQSIAKRSKGSSAHASGGFGKAALFYGWWVVIILFGSTFVGDWKWEQRLFAAMFIAIFPVIINYYAVYPRK